jgi:hypothetical protein
MRPGHLVGQKQPRHQEHPALRHPPDLVDEDRGLAVEKIGGRAQVMLLARLAGDLELAPAHGDRHVRHGPLLDQGFEPGEDLVDLGLAGRGGLAQGLDLGLQAALTSDGIGKPRAFASRSAAFEARSPAFTSRIRCT